MLFFTSDLHFRHKNVINYCLRPFPDILKMEEYLISHWNLVVAPTDTIYILGDFSLNPKVAGLILPQLNGEKHLIMGNHDACFPSHKKAEKMRRKYLENGLKTIALHETITLSNGRNVLLSHLPYGSKEGTEYDKRYLAYRPEDRGMFLLHGHLHGRYKKHGRMIDVSIDAHEMKIISEPEIIQLIDDPRDFIPSHLTEHYKNQSQREHIEGM